MLRMRDLVNLTVEKTGDYKGNTRDAIEACFEVIAEQLCLGEEVSIPSFGIFRVEKIAPRPYFDFNNLESHEWVMSKGKKLPKFCPSKCLLQGLKDSLCL